MYSIDLLGNTTNKTSIEYSEISSAFTVKDGVFTFQDTTLLTPSGRMLGSGSGDLVTDEINLKMKPSIVNVDRGLDISKNDAQSLMLVAVTGTFSSPVFVVGKKNPFVENAQKLVDEKIPSPVDDDVKGLVGKALIDPEIVARRFGLQQVEIKCRKSKKVFPVGNGKIKIGQLLEEDVFRDLQGGID
jgi:hypothetical protein